MILRLFALAIVVLLLAAMTISFVWIQAGFPGGLDVNPRAAQLSFFPTIFALWIPLIYLFFSVVWSYLARRLSERQGKTFLRYDVYSYVAIIGFVGLQVIQKDFTSPTIPLKAFVLLILFFKSWLLLWVLYRFPQLIHPWLLLLLSFGLYLLSIPLIHLPPYCSIPDLFQHVRVLHLGIIAVKAICLSVMMVEMFRLSKAMTKSVRSAFLSWIIVAFSFPGLNFPKINFLLGGLLIVFVLRMIISRLDTRELMIGLLEPTSLTIAIKFVFVLAIISAAGLVFWSNVRPGFVLQWFRISESAIGTLFNGQFGPFLYSPVYWLSLCGIVYLLFFRVWDGILLIVTGGVLYLGYHFVNYGMLGKITGQYDSIPFLPFLGVFIAVAHHRFGQFALFRIVARVLIIMTFILTGMLLLLPLDMPSITARVSEIQHIFMKATGHELVSFFPSIKFNTFPPIFSLYIAGIIGCAFLCCYFRTRAFSLGQKRRSKVKKVYCYHWDVSYFPTILLIFLLCGTGGFLYSKKIHSLPLQRFIQLSSAATEHHISLAESPLATIPARGIIIVSNLINSVMIPEQTPLVNMTIADQEQQFESFIIKAGRDTSEETLDLLYITRNIAHDRAAIYHTWSMTTEDGINFEAHDYYTKFLFSKPIYAQKISFKLLTAKDLNLPPGVRLHIKNIFLLE